MYAIERRARRVLVIAAMRARAKVSPVAVLVDARCRRMNTGLAAVAMVLGLILVAKIAMQGESLTVAEVTRAVADGVPVSLGF